MTDFVTATAGLPTLEIIERLREQGVLVTYVAGKVRMLTHVDVSTEDIDAALRIWRTVLAEARPSG